MTTVPLKEALERGIALQQSGQTEQAEKVFRQLISQHPTNPDVLNLLGVVLMKRKRQREAADLFRMAVALRGEIAEFHQNLAGALHALRAWPDAERAARTALELKPSSGAAWGLLGAILAGLRRREEAKECYCRAL